MALAERTWERRQLLKRAKVVSRDGRDIIPFAAEFVAVQAAEEGEEGAFFDSGSWIKPVGDTILTGADLNTLTRRWERPVDDEDRIRHYYSESQRPVLEFGARSAIRRMVVVGSMGSAKSEGLAAWVVKMSQRYRNAMIGVFAPTGARRMILYKKIRRRLPPHWIADGGIRTTEGTVELINGVVLKFVALKEASKDLGSPAAGLDLVAAAIDEEQDCSQDALDEVEMRGRAAPGGFFPVLSSCTLKDTPEWRTRKAKYDAASSVRVYRMLLKDNPWVHPDYVAGLEKSLSPRAYRMRVLALDARPELATYPDFDRKIHVRPRPRIGVKDVTRSITNASMLIAHDPGKLWNVSLGLKAFSVRGHDLPLWWVVWEISTREKLLSHHIQQVDAELKDYNLTAEDALVVADPYSDSGEKKPGLAVYRTWRNAGYKARPAAYGKRNVTGPGQVKKDDGIEVVNSLLLNAAGVTRLHIDCDERGTAVAEKLVEALETQARDLKGEAETDRKDSHDTSHWPAALRYGLYPWERVRIESAMSKRNS